MNTNRASAALLFSFGFLIALAGAASAAAVPRTIFYQGRITDDTGRMINQTVDLDFTLYDAATGGNVVWGPESFTSISVENGVFSRYLGATYPFSDTIFAQKCWMELKVNSNAFSPRTEFAASPYAMNALTLEGQDSSKFAKVAGDTFTGRVVLDTLDARTAQGIRFRDDGGNIGIYLKDGGAVGIGTTTIEATNLQIAGTYDQMVIAEADGAANEKRWLFRANSRYFDITTGNDAWSSWTEAFKIGRSGITVDTVGFPNGKVAIGGIDDLQGKLTIKSTGDHLMVEETDGATDEKKWVHKADALFYEIITANDAWSSWTAAMRLGRRGTAIDTVAFPSGRFGIGTSNPAAKLDVVGTVIIQDSLVVGGTGGDSFVVLGSGNVGIGTKSPGQKLVINGGDNEAVNILGSGTGYMFLGFDQNTRNVRIGGWDGSFQNFLIEGKVALGGDTPGSKLTVRGDVAVEDSFSVGGADGDSLMVTGSGRVGIGTKSPGHKLDVIGHELIQGHAGWDAHAETATLFLGDANTMVRAVRDTGMIFGLYQVDTVLWLKQVSGFVGVRTNNDPQWGLHVVHGSGGGVMIEEDGSWSTGDTATIFFGDAGALIYNDWNNGFVIKANKDIVLTTSGSGNQIGVRTDTPSLAFEVSGGIKSDSIVTQNVISTYTLIKGLNNVNWGCCGYGNPANSWFALDPRDYCPPTGNCEYKLGASFGTITAGNIDVQVINNSSGSVTVVEYLNFSSDVTNMTDAWTSYGYNGEATFSVQVRSDASTDFTCHTVTLFIRMEQ